MKNLIFALIMAMAASFQISAQTQLPETYFPYPQVPDDITTLSGRCNYLVDKFWERCNLKQSFSAQQKLEGALADWISFMPYATADTVEMSIERLMEDAAKVGAEQQAMLARMAERHVYSDSAEIYSEQVYYPFCKAVAENKKASKADKAYFGRQAHIIENCGLGKKMLPFEFTTANGEKKSFGDVLASRVVVIVLDPSSMESSLMKVRIAADYNINNLISNNLLRILALYPGPVTPELKSQMEGCPDNWVVGAMENLGDNFDAQGPMTLYYLDARHKVLGKNLTTEQLLAGLGIINQEMQTK